MVAGDMVKNMKNIECGNCIKKWRPLCDDMFEKYEIVSHISDGYLMRITQDSFFKNWEFTVKFYDNNIEVEFLNKKMYNVYFNVQKQVIVVDIPKTLYGTIHESTLKYMFV